MTIPEIIKALPPGTRFMLTIDSLVIEGPDEWHCAERLPEHEHVLENDAAIRDACARASA